MRTFMTLLLLSVWVGVANATSIWTEEIYTWVIRFFIMQWGGNWG